MKTDYKILIGGLTAITIIDSGGSIASRLLNFNYASLVFGTMLVYGTVGFLATRASGLKPGVYLAALVGFFDSTVGWVISLSLGANTGDLNNDPTALVWIITSVFVTVFAALIGLMGGGLAKVLKK